MAAPPPAQTDRNSVSASELVRQFGLWQEQAAREPVYVMHRGRARLVLTSVDLMNRLCAPRDAASNEAIEHALLLDILREPVVRLDAERTVVAINPAAQAWLGRTVGDAIGRTLVDLVGDGIGGYCDALIQRSMRFATIETAELPIGQHRMTLTIAPLAPGAILVGVERSASDMDHIADDIRRTLSAAMTATGIGHCHINLRGYIAQCDAGFERMSRLAAPVLASARFVTLFSVASRVAIGDALDQVLRDGEPKTVEGTLQRNRASDLPVTVGVAALRPRAAIEAAIAVVRERPA